MAADWVEVGSADNAVATATRAAESGRAHRLRAVIASYDGNKSGLLTVTAGDWTISVEVFDELDIEFSGDGLIGREGAAMSASLAASGTGGTTGYVNLIGDTV